MPLDSIGYLSPTGYVETKIVDADGGVLRRAADIIEERGWLQHNWGYPDGARCINGALVEAAESFGFHDTHAAAIADRRLGDCFIGCMNWNNAPGRTKAEVIARLRSAAEQGAS